MYFDSRQKATNLTTAGQDKDTINTAQYSPEYP